MSEPIFGPESTTTSPSSAPETETEEYRQQATTVEGYFWHRDPPQHPTVLELMAGPRS